jgi:hypothetical protein
LDPSFAGSNPAEDNRLLKAIEVRSTTSFGEEVKSSASCREISQPFKEPRGVLKRYNVGKSLGTFFVKFFPSSLLGVSAGVCQRALVDESGKIRTQMEAQNKSENDRSA